MQLKPVTKQLAIFNVTDSLPTPRAEVRGETLPKKNLARPQWSKDSREADPKQNQSSPVPQTGDVPESLASTGSD